MKSTYMDYACMGRPADKTIQAVSLAISELSNWDEPGTGRTLRLFKEVDQARATVANFLRVRPEHIAFVDNTTHGLGLIASSLQLEKNNNIVVPDIEFISSTIIWRQRQKQIGFEIRPVITQNGKLTLQDFSKVIDRNTKAIIVSSVQEVSGYRIDLHSLSKLAEEQGAILIVDGIQEAGVLEVDLSRTKIHAYCAGGHKWIGSPFGLGFMYIHPEIYEKVNPIYEGYFNQREPEEGWEQYLQNPKRTPFDDLQPLVEARKFETGGTPHWLGAIGLRTAIESIEEQGLTHIREKIAALHTRLQQNLQALGLGEYILGEMDSGWNSSITTYGLPRGMQQARQLIERLLSAKVYVSLRSISGIGGIRVSPYYSNTIEDIDRLSEITESVVSKGR